MQYFEAIRLGMLHQQLGLRANTRVVFQIITEGALGAFVWDLESGNTHLVMASQGVIRGQRPVPESVKKIINLSDEDLKKRWLSTEGWDDDRESLMSELNIRGVDILRLEGI